jgi:hypothetical protein
MLKGRKNMIEGRRRPARRRRRAKVPKTYSLLLASFE